MFEEHIAESYPAHWAAFFESMRGKVKSLTYEHQYAVFKVKSDPELLRLLAQDAKLQRYILKGEQYHILVREKDVPKVKRRLRQFGYLM